MRKVIEDVNAYQVSSIYLWSSLIGLRQSGKRATIVFPLETSKKIGHGISLFEKLAIECKADQISLAIWPEDNDFQTGLVRFRCQKMDSLSRFVQANKKQFAKLGLRFSQDKMGEGDIFDFFAEAIDRRSFKKSPFNVFTVFTKNGFIWIAKNRRAAQRLSERIDERDTRNRLRDNRNFRQAVETTKSKADIAFYVSLIWAKRFLDSKSTSLSNQVKKYNVQPPYNSVAALTGKIDFDSNGSLASGIVKILFTRPRSDSFAELDTVKSRHSLEFDSAKKVKSAWTTVLSNKVPSLNFQKLANRVLGFGQARFVPATDKIIQPFLDLVAEKDRQQLFGLTTGKITILETKNGAKGLVFRVNETDTVLEWLNELEERNEGIVRGPKANSFQTVAKPYWPSEDRNESPRSVQSVLMVKDGSLIVSPSMVNAMEIASLSKNGTKNLESADVSFWFAKSEIANSVARWQRILPVTLWQKEIDDLPVVPKEITVYKPVRFTGRSTRFFESLHLVSVAVCKQIESRCQDAAVVKGSIRFTDAEATTTFSVK